MRAVVTMPERAERRRTEKIFKPRRRTERVVI